MAFHITKTHHNSYRCSCCRHESDSDSWVDTLEEALAEVPTTIPDDGEFGGLYAVEVIDGSTGEKVAWGSVLWSTGFGKYSGYQYTGWSGFRPDTGAFEVVQNREGQRVEKTWAQVQAELAETHRQAEIRRLEGVEAETRKALEALKAG